MPEALSFRQTLRDWRTWLPILAWLVAGIGGAQAMLNDLFMGLPMFWYHVGSGALQAVLVLVPASLYVVWRQTAQRARAALEELRETERMREDLVAMLVHDLKNPAISAGMALDLLLEEPHATELLTERDLAMIVSARRNLRRLEGMVGDALQIAAAQERPLTLRLAPGDLCAVVAQAVVDAGPQAELRSVALSVDGRCELPAFTFDQEKLRRVLDNLIGNAIEHTPAGGRVEVTIARTEAEVQVTVADSGEGVSEELRERIFERYAQAERSRAHQIGSVGLGLAFCRLAVEAHGGRIWVEPSKLGGSDFIFTLPLQQTGNG